MAVGFTQWTVLKHQPIDKLESNLWHVSGKMKGGNERKMVVAKRSDGDLVLFNAIALDDAEMTELEAFGTPKYLVIPNGFHRQDALIYKQRYPDMKVIAGAGAAKAVAKAVPIDMTTDQYQGDGDVLVTSPAGFANKEAMLIVKHPGGGQTVATCDAILNMTSADAKFPFSVLLAPVDTPSTPRFIQWMMIKDRKAWQAQLAELAATSTRLIPGHGLILSDGSAALRGVSALLG